MKNLIFTYFLLIGLFFFNQVKGDEFSISKNFRYCEFEDGSIIRIYGKLKKGLSGSKKKECPKYSTQVVKSKYDKYIIACRLLNNC